MVTLKVYLFRNAQIPILIQQCNRCLFFLSRHKPFSFLCHNRGIIKEGFCKYTIYNAKKVRPAKKRTFIPLFFPF